MLSHRFQRRHLAVALAALLMVSAPGMAGEQAFLPNMLPFDNATGTAATFSTAGKVDLTGAFFQSLGTNGRACVTCHQPSTGRTVTPQNIEARFDGTKGMDPIFRTNDGSNSPTADVSTVDARCSAYSMLLSKGLIRVGIGIPSITEIRSGRGRRPVPGSSPPTACRRRCRVLPFDSDCASKDDRKEARS